MAQWRLKPAEPQPPAKLQQFDPDDWVLAARGNPARTQTALDRWHQARLDWVMADPNHRTIGGMDVIAIIFETP